MSGGTEIYESLLQTASRGPLLSRAHQDRLTSLRPAMLAAELKAHSLKSGPSNASTCTDDKSTAVGGAPHVVGGSGGGFAASCSTNVSQSLPSGNAFGLFGALPPRPMVKPSPAPSLSESLPILELPPPSLDEETGYLGSRCK